MRELAVLALLAAGSLSGACTTLRGTAPRVKPAEAEALVRGGSAVLVDVRESSEIADGGMAAPAVSIPMSKVEAGDPAWTDLLAKTPKDRKLIFYCRSGRRSGVAARLAIEAGRDASNMGGFQDWVRAKFPTRPKP